MLSHRSSVKTVVIGVVVDPRHRVENPSLWVRAQTWVCGARTWYSNPNDDAESIARGSIELVLLPQRHLLIAGKLFVWSIAWKSIDRRSIR